MRKMTAIKQSKPKKKKQRVAAYCHVSTDKTEQQHSFRCLHRYYKLTDAVCRGDFGTEKNFFHSN